MSNLPTIFDNADALLSKYKHLLKNNDSLSSGMSENVPSIKIENKNFAAYDSGEKVAEGSTFSGVIVASGELSRKYFSKAYTGKSAEAPDCFSLDGKRPHETATKPQNKLCAACPFNNWGSAGIEGSKRKKCSEFRRIAVCVITPSDPKGYKLYRFSVPTASLRNLANYKLFLTSKNAPMNVVLTQFGFDPEVKISKVTFDAVKLLDEVIVENVLMKAMSDPMIPLLLEVSDDAAEHQVGSDELDNSIPFSGQTTDEPVKETKIEGKPVPKQEEVKVAASVLADNGGFANPFGSSESIKPEKKSPVTLDPEFMSGMKSIVDEE